MINEEKKATFEFYTYEITPTTTYFRLFEEDLDEIGIKSIEELRQRKNLIFKDVITSDVFYFNYKRVQLLHKILYADDNYIIVKIANRKVVKAEVGFKTVIYPHEPSILVVIDNRADKQQIAIENAPAVFSSTSVVVKLFHASLDRILAKYHLAVAINNRFDPQDFWSLIAKNAGRIKELKIELTRENLSEIYKTISKQLVDYGESTNSQTVIVTQQAPKGSVLENLTPENEDLNDMVVASSKGTGPITLKLVGDRKSHSTKDKNITNTVHYDISADGLTLEQAIELINKIYS